MRTPDVERMTAPVTPWELWFAMRLIGAVGTGNRTGPEAGAHRFARGGVALSELVGDRGKAASLNLRAWAVSDMVKDERIKDWSRGTDLHLALFVAAAELPMTDDGGFDANDFFQRVKDVAERYSVDEIKSILNEGRQEQLERAASDYLNALQIPKPPHITGNDYCPCKSGKKYKKCHGMKESSN